MNRTSEIGGQIQKDGALHVSYSQNAQGDTTLRNFAAIGSENIFANGFENVVLRTPEFAANQVLNYDRAHRLTSITGVESYQYDAHGRRVLTTRTSDGLKRYQLYSNSGVLMHTEDQRTSEIIDYVNLEGQLVAERTTPLFGGMVTTRYQHADLRGSPTVVSSAGGTQIERSIEQPFGAPYDGIYRDGPGFTRHATDAASGLSYMQQRYYDPVAMRFLSVDPVAANAGMGFSRYAYGANNPFKFVDPDGRAGKVAWLVKLVGDGMKKIRRIDMSEATKARRAGENVVADRKQLAKQIETAANGRADQLKHDGHVLSDGSKGMPHYQTDDAMGHSFWGKLSSSGLAVIGAVAEILDPASYGSPAPGELENHEQSWWGGYTKIDPKGVSFAEALKRQGERIIENNKNDLPTTEEEQYWRRDLINRR